MHYDIEKNGLSIRGKQLYARQDVIDEIYSYKVHQQHADFIENPDNKEWLDLIPEMMSTGMNPFKFYHFVMSMKPFLENIKQEKELQTLLQTEGA